MEHTPSRSTEREEREAYRMERTLLWGTCDEGELRLALKSSSVGYLSDKCTMRRRTT